MNDLKFKAQTERKCKSCKNTKAISFFYKNNLVCKKCRTAKNKAREAEKRESNKVIGFDRAKSSLLAKVRLV